MVAKIALEEHFLCPGFEDYWNATVGDVDPTILAQVLARLTDFGDAAPRSPWTTPASRARCCRSPAPACRPNATPPPPSARRATPTTSSRAKSRSGPTAIRVSRHLPMQDANAAADELERCMRELKFSRRHDQRPHQRAISRPSRRSHPFWERAEALGAVDLSPSGRSGDARARARRTQGPAARDLGMGASRPGRTRCAWCSAACSTASRARSWGSAIWARRCRSCSGVSTAAPSSTASSSRKSPSEYIRDNIFVTTSGMCSAEPLNCTSPRSGATADVRRRLPVRVGGGGRALHRQRGARRDVRTDICFDNAGNFFGLKNKESLMSGPNDRITTAISTKEWSAAGRRRARRCASAASTRW